MSKNLFDPTKQDSINQKFREKRFVFFRGLYDSIKSESELKILDIGGTEVYWERMNFPGDENVSITLLNLEEVEIQNPKFNCVKGNACDLSEFADDEFDIVFSNSVIEHLYTFENQMKMADEVKRVGKNYFIQTPNRYFPIEPHWIFPLFQFFPFHLKVFLTQNFDIGNYKKTGSRNLAEQRCREVQLLSEKQMKLLFPDGKVYREKFFGLTKSITMFNFSEK